MLKTTIIIGTSKSCAKSASLGYIPSCCKYFGFHGSTLCVEPKLRLLDIFLCPCFNNLINMSNTSGLLKPDYNETQNIDGELQILQHM